MTEDPKKRVVTDAIKRAAHNKINDGLCFLLGGNRFYYYIISNIKVQPSQDVATIEVGFANKQTKKLCIRYNPQFIADFYYKDFQTGQETKFDFSEQEIADILVHELLHICLRHLFNCESYTDKEVLNYAQDIIVNDMIFRNRYEYTKALDPKSRITNKPSLLNFLVTKHLFEGTKNLNIQEHTFGDLYGILQQEFQKNPNLRGQLGEKQKNGQLIKDGHAEFQPDENGEGQGEAEAQGPQSGEIEAMLKALLNKAMRENFDRGRLPAELLKELNALEPKKDYKDTLNHFLKNCKVDVLQKTWKKPSKRYGNISKGNTADFKPNILLIVDSSGSVFGHPKALEKISEYFSFATNHCESIRLIMIDTVIHLDKVFVQGDAIPQMAGGGGTVMQPAFDKAQEYEVDGICFLTDGYTDTVDTHDIPTVALIVPGGTVPPGIEEHDTVFFTTDD